MESTAGARKRKRSASTASAAVRYIPEELVHKILLRLPSRSVLRFRAVCKAWRDLFSDPNFVLEHHRLQPDLPLVSFLRSVSEELDIVDHCVEALDPRTGDFRSVVRFTDSSQRCFRIYGSCDGLLLVNFEGSLYVCNPATHQWSCLGEPDYSSHLVAFYRHDPTGEYRALFYVGNGSSRNYYIIVAGSGMGRSLGQLPSAEDEYNFHSSPSGEAALLRGSLHWPPERWDNRRILVLDTATEVFRWMAPPPVLLEHTSVLVMEGKLAVFSCGEDVRVVELWLLQDYEKQMWVCKYHVELPALEISTLPGLDIEFDMNDWLRFFISEGRVAVVIPQQRLLLCDMNGNLHERFRCDVCALMITRYTLKESLVRHAFFEIKDNKDTSEDESPPIFRGL